MEVLMLGRPAILDGDARHVPRPGKTSAVLYLAAYRGDWIDREELLAMFWPDFDESRARANLRQVLNVVRNQPFTAGPEIESNRIRWRVSSDVTAFRALESKDDVAAVRIYRGPLMDGFRVPEAPAFEAWLTAEREAIHRAFRHCALRVGRALTAGSRPADAAELFARLLQHDPFDEAVVRERMAALQAARGVSEALEFYTGFAESLAEEVGLEPELATSDLAEAMRASRTATSAPPSGPTQSPLPRPTTRFVGRIRDLAHICTKLTEPHVRFLDLTGPGGIGKTRLAIEAAHHVQDAFPGGVSFVSLAHVARSEEIHDRIAAVLRITPSAQRSALETIADTVGATDTLLVLDNLESIDGAGGPIVELLQAAPALTLLGTSRAVLGVEGEVVVPVQGLDISERTSAIEHQPLGPGHSDAVTLFLEAAVRNLPTYDPGPAELAGIVRVCRATGGMPLAIELAAQWVRVMSAAELAGEIARDLTRLTRRHASVEGRHGSIRALFDRSWARLDDEQRRALVALSVFRGPFTSADAVHVAGIDPGVVLELVDRSLLEALGEGRLDQHPLIRSYVRERSEEQPRIVAEARHAHAELYATRLSPWSDRVFGPGDREALHALDPLIADARAAWQFAVEAQRWDWLAAMLPAMNRYHDTRHMVGPFLELVADALHVIPRREPMWQHLVQIHVCRLVGERRYTEAIAASDHVMGALRERGEGWRRASVMCWTGVAYAMLGQAEAAAEIWREALAVPGVGARPRVEGRLITNLSFVVTAAEDADRLLARGVRKAREEGATLDLSWMLRNQSIHLLRTYGRYVEAERIAREAVERVQAFSEGNVVTALQNLAYVQLVGGWLDRAEAAIREADELIAGLHEPRRTTARLENLHLHAHLLADRGEAAAALALCRESLESSDSNVHRLLLARLYVATGRGREAAITAASLARSAERQDGIRGRIYMRIMADLLAADAARLQDDTAAARFLAADALERATEHTFLPAALHGLVVAASILDRPDGRRFSAVARLHPASSHDTRTRACRAAKRDELDIEGPGFDDENVRAMSHEAIGALHSEHPLAASLHDPDPTGTDAVVEDDDVLNDVVDDDAFDRATDDVLDAHAEPLARLTT